MCTYLTWLTKLCIYMEKSEKLPVFSSFTGKAYQVTTVQDRSNTVETVEEDVADLLWPFYHLTLYQRSYPLLQSSFSICPTNCVIRVLIVTRQTSHGIPLSIDVALVFPWHKAKAHLMYTSDHNQYIIKTHHLLRKNLCRLFLSRM